MTYDGPHSIFLDKFVVFGDDFVDDNFVIFLQDIDNRVEILAAYPGCVVAIVLLLLSRSILFNGLCNLIVLGLVALPS